MLPYLILEWTYWNIDTYYKNIRLFWNIYTTKNLIAICCGKFGYCLTQSIQQSGTARTKMVTDVIEFTAGGISCFIIAFTEGKFRL